MPTPTLLRRASYSMLGFAFLVLGLYAIQQTLALQAQRSSERAEALAGELQRLLSIWEQSQMATASAWLTEIATADDLMALHERYQQTPYFDAFYVWEPGETGPIFLHPPPHLEEDFTAFEELPCLARIEAAGGPEGPTVTEALDQCPEGTTGERLYLVSRAADMLSADERFQEAWNVLDSAPVSLETPVSKAPTLGVAPRRLITNRVQAAEVRGRLGDTDGQIRMLLTAAQQIASCNGALLEELLPLLGIPIQDDLLRLGATQEAADVEQLRAAVERHLAGFQEVRDRLSLRDSLSGSPAMESPTGATTSEPRVVIDQYGDQGYLLIYALVGEKRGTSAAIQLDPDALLDDLLAKESVGSDDGPMPLSILDANGKLVRGFDPQAGESSGPPAPVQWIQVPFRELLPHLRLAVHLSAASERGREISGLASQTMPVVIAFVLGVLAMAGRASADRQARELYMRQQEFIARVTHELKTPLAGIRVMAETLELGMIHDAAKRELFLQRILQETERLGRRIDEVLKVARKPEVVPKEKVLVHELATDLARTWRPRFEQAGAALEIDLQPTAPTLADRDMLRDALSNLLDNALKYLREDRPGLVRLRTRTEGRHAVFEVSDNGLGVPPAMRKRIFQAFTRVEGPGRGKSGGHGLGLSFVADTVRGHGGTVECREGIDGGACFVVRLRSS